MDGFIRHRVAGKSSVAANNYVKNFARTLARWRGIPASIVALWKLGDSSRVADDLASLHTPTMTLKNAALLALIGTILATVLLVWTFVSTALNVLRGLAPPVMLFPWFVYAFACFSVAVFFYVFHRAQS